MFIAKEERERINELYAMSRNGEINSPQLLLNKELNGDWKRQHFYKPTKGEAIRASLYEWMHDYNFRQKVGWGYQEYNFKDILTDCPIPTLMCEGKWDLTWVEEKKDIFRQSQPLAQFVLFENAGHAIFSEDPELFFSELKKFITTLSVVSTKDVTSWKKRISPLIEPQEQFFYKENKFIRLIETTSLDEGLAFYVDFKKKYPHEKLFSQSAMSNLGYKFRNTNDNLSAIRVFELNLEEYPQSAAIYGDLGDIYTRTGDKQKAKEYYTKSLEIKPNNDWIKQALQKLENE